MTHYRGHLLLIVLAVLASTVSGRTCPPMTAHGVCTRDVVTNIMTLEFRLNLQTAPAGAFAVYPSNAQGASTCPINLVSGVYQLSVNVDLGTQAAPSGQSGCGVTYTAVNQAYTWRLIYYELADRTDVDGGCDRLYTVVCDVNNIVDLQVAASVSVSTPDLEEDVTPYRPDVEYYVVGETQPGSNVFVRINAADEVPVQTNLKLRLVYRFGTYNPNRYSQIAGLLTTVDRTSQHTNPFAFFNQQGCPNSALAPNSNFGFRYATPTEAGTSVRETDVFPAFRFDQIDAQRVYFRTIISFCYGVPGSVTPCYDPCNNGNAQRKRRQATEEPEYVTASIRIVDAKTDASPVENDNDTLVYAVVGACISICLLLIILLAVMLFLVRRRRQRKAEEKKVPPQVFANDVKVQY